MYFAKRYKIALLLLISLFLLFQLYVGFGEMLFGVYRKPLLALKSCFILYIREHGGEYPISEKILWEEGYIKKSISAGKSDDIYLKVLSDSLVEKKVSTSNNQWILCHTFNDFHIIYDIEK